MPKSYSPYAPKQFFNVIKLSDISGISKDRLYNSFSGKKNTLTEEEQMKILNALDDALLDLKKLIVDNEG